MKFGVPIRGAASALFALLSGIGFSQSLPHVFVPESSIRKPGVNPWVAHTNYLIYTGKWTRKSVDNQFNPEVLFGPALTSSIQGYHPADIRAAYDIPAGGGANAIAVIDAYDLPTNLNDFNVFSNAFGLPTETSSSATATTNKVFQVIYASGTKPAKNASWGGEIALDIEWAHALAPNAKIYLIECASDNLSDLFAGVQYAATNLPDVREVNMSFGATETSNEQTTDSTFLGTNKVFFSSAGDNSNEVDYPAASPNVVGVGGTTLNINNGVFESEIAWNSSGGGPSIYELLPSYQSAVKTITGNFRGTPDMAADADPNTGCAIYDSTPVQGQQPPEGWMVVGGTSLASPICAGIANVRGSYSASTFAELTRDYSFLGSSLFRDISQGQDGLYNATIGYDLITGIGTPTGVFPDYTYKPTSITVPFGTPVSGVAGNMVQLDNHDYIVRSVLIDATTMEAQVSGTFATSLSSSSNILTATLTVTGQSSAASTVVSLYNQNTQNWDTILTIPGPTKTTQAVPITTLANYIDANGKVQFTIVGTNTGTSPGPFLLGIDQIQLTASTF